MIVFKNCRFTKKVVIRHALSRQFPFLHSAESRQRKFYVNDWIMNNMWHLFFILLVLGSRTCAQRASEDRSTGLIPEQDDPLILVSTLSGSFMGIGQRTGEIRWHQDNEPVVKVPQDITRRTSPMFLPDPKDGSLYLYGAELEVLKKLPFTIPQLVASSPCRSSDGILYTGRKTDTWFSIDPVTGGREQLLGFEEAESTCPLDIQDAIFVGRTEYNIIMIDSKRKERKWNITFYDYSASKIDDTVDDYELVHFTTSSTGRVVTLDRRLGIVLWELDLSSPVIGIYSISKDGLVTVPFTSVAEGTLDNLLKRFTSKPSDIQLFPTLYIGEHGHGLYALPSLVDSATATISSNSGHLMLEGPPVIPQIGKNDNTVASSEEQASNAETEPSEEQFLDGVTQDNNIIVLGHYKVPAEYKPQNQPLQITGRSDPIIQSPGQVANVSNKITLVVESSDDLDKSADHRNWKRAIADAYNGAKKWLNQQENKGLKLALIILVGCVITMFWYLNAQFKEFQQLSQGSRENSRTSSTGGRNGVTIVPEEIAEGTVRIGKIIINIDQVLGKGCEGTFVYKGEFDGRPVAVKRLLPECFTFADREVALLRESDSNENVVRYFCTEQDRMFRYIALELAQATLNDYVIGTYDRQTISVKKILFESTKGLAHLHSLHIVHRDIKPHNVLLSMPSAGGEVKAMISDFGLCKKLHLGRMSFSRRSGITGTDGWIAPEMLNGERTTCAVDIFSLGCVFYFVLSNGKHPFGDTLRRQANILCGESDLSSFHDIQDYDKELALVLIRAMIDSDPTRRPPARAIMNFPFFWNHGKILHFFQEVSDRGEKEESSCINVRALETGWPRVVKSDWKAHIDEEVVNDLRKYRSYRGESVRDLLRALRNKKHHYKELTPEAQRLLGKIPNQFAEYWLTRFPSLLSHSWCVMQPFRNEGALHEYYDTKYEFTTYPAYERLVDVFNGGGIEEIPSADSSPLRGSPTPKTPWRQRQRNGIDASPNGMKHRPYKRRYQKKNEEQVVGASSPAI